MNTKCKCGCGLDAHLAIQALVKRWPNLTVSSGARCAAHNAKVKGAPASNHVLGLAVDFATTKPAELMAEMLAAGEFLWFEDPAVTKTWLHCQVVPYRSWVFGKPMFFKV